MQEYIVQVAPLTPLPINKTQVFSYLHDEEVPSGSLVRVPFGYKFVSGIVVSSFRKKKFQDRIRLKNILAVIEKSFLTENQLRMAKQIAEHYVCPLGIVLKNMVPRRVKSRKSKGLPKKKKLKITRQKISQDMLQAKGTEYVLNGAVEKRLAITLSLAELVSKSGAQTFFLVSEVLGAWSVYENVKKYFRDDELALVYSGMPKGKYFSEWQKVKQGRAKIIIATKLGVYLPFRDLGLIVIKNSQDVSFKQWDMTPRYSAVRASFFLAEIFAAKTVFSGPAISVEEWKKCEEKKAKLVSAGARDLNISYEKIDLFAEKKSADFPLTKRLYEKICGALEQKKKILLIVSRRGHSKYSICRSCKNVLRCPDCERALVYFEQTEKYCCLHCSHKIDILTSCPTCGACDFSHMGAGIDLVEKKISRLFPGKKVTKLTRDFSKSESNRKNLALIPQNTEIVLGTQVALKVSDVPSFDLVAFLNFDELQSFPEYGAPETAQSLLLQGAELVKKGGELILQKFFAGNDAPTVISEKEKLEFLSSELGIRKKMNMPPFSRLIMLICREKNKKKLDTEAQRVFDLLARVGNNEIDVGEPYEPLVAKKRNFYLKNILIKIDPALNIRSLPIFPILASLGKSWIVDVDPIATT